MIMGFLVFSGGECLGFCVEGMDCVSCVGKIEIVLNCLGGIIDVIVNFVIEML